MTGTYTIRISSATTGYGAYTVYYVAGGGGTSGGALTSGATLSDTLPAGGLTSYTFSGTSGQGMQLRFAASGLSYNTNIKVYLPSGAYQNVAGNSYIMTLPTTGTYTVVVQGTTTAATGSYSLAYFMGGGAVSDGKIGSGGTLSGTMPAGLMQSFTFNGTSGHAAAFSTGISFPVETYIYKPDGSLYTSYGGANWVNVTSLPVTNTWTIVIAAQTYGNTAADNVYFVHGNDEVSEGYLYNGLSRPGTMPVAGLMSYRFDATGSHTITVTTSCSFATGTGCYFLVYKPDGSYWGMASGSPWSGTLPAASGEYVLVLYEPSLSKTGSYTAEVAITPTTVPPSTSAACPVCDALAAMAATVDSIIGQSLDVGPAWPSRPSSRRRFRRAAFWRSRPGLGYSLASAGNTMSAAASALGGALPFIGAGMQFDDGFKQETVTDYRAGGLSFVRTYRSDSSWTNNTIGKFWRHNYARTLTVVPTTSASITDGTGVTSAYTWSGSAWTPSDPSNRATLQTVAGGWVFTLPNNTVEKYNNSELLTRIEYLGGGQR